MSNTIVRAAVGISLVVAASQTLALDTSKPLLCAVTQVQECVDGAGCSQVLPEEVNAPTFLRLNIKKKHIRSSMAGEPAPIRYQQSIKGRLVLMGAEQGTENQPDGGGWTLSIEEDTGRFAGSMVVRQATINLFGACTEPFYD